MLQGLILLCTVLALSSGSALPHHRWTWAHPDHHRGVKAQDHDAEWTAKNEANADQAECKPQVCRSAVAEISINGGTKRRSYHLCRQESPEPETGVFKEVDCYYTNAPCCIPVSFGILHSIVELSVEGQSEPFPVKFYSVENQTDVCYRTYDDIAEEMNIVSCLQNPECIPSCVTTPKILCINNTVNESEESCFNMTCKCKVGYQPQNCCECSLGYVKVNEICEEVCQTNCAIRIPFGGCDKCRKGYKKPTCCNCTEFFYKDADEKCQPGCVNNTVNNCEDEECVCKPGFGGPDCCQCRNNSISCTDTECVCQPGYAGPDCCNCDEGYYRASNGECKETCLNNTLNNCENEECVCKAGFGGPDCCQCRNNSISCTDTECVCQPGYTGPDCCKCDVNFYRASNGECKESCLNNTLNNCENEKCVCKAGFGGPDCCQCRNNSISCTDTECMCQPGYAGPDCCKCDEGYYRASNGECKETCLNNTLNNCENEECVCKAGFGGPDCCQCRNNSISCTDTECVCQPGYTGPDCCKCDVNFYRASNGECKEPCLNNTLNNCENEECVCKPGFGGPDCCQCRNNSISCTDTECVCQPGYTGPDCCKCDVNFYRASNGECKESCLNNTLNNCENEECVCKAGFGGPDCCQCRNNSISCTDTECVCQPGYTGPDCCKCDVNFYRASNGECKEPCLNKTLNNCENEECVCKPGFGGPDCCQCRNNSISCTDTECVCQPGYAGSDCCKCDKGYYRASNGECKEPRCEGNVDFCEDEKCICNKPYGPEPDCCYCVDNIDLSSCTEDGRSCTCKKGFEGDDCCDNICIAAQDIYFLVDATKSNRRPTFCEEIYAIQLISAALRPNVGDDVKALSGTRVGAYLYPKDYSTLPKDLKYFGLGDFECTGTIEQFHRVMQAFTFDKEDLNDQDLILQRESLRGSITLPVPSLNMLASVLKGDVEKYGADRRRIVIILTDGPPDDNAGNVKNAVENLLKNGGNMFTLIAAGIGSQLSTQSKYNEFVDHVKLLANNSDKNSYVTPRGTTDNAGILLGNQLVNIMERNGAICKTQADTIRSRLNATKGVYYCDCNVYRIHPNRPDPCKASCPEDLYKEGRDKCQAAPIKECSLLAVRETAQAEVKVESKDPELISLEEEIIAAVENVLIEEGIIEVDRD